MLSSAEEARALLEKLGASHHLLQHLALVGEAAEEVIAGLTKMAIPFDQDFVRLGVAVHDAGKILHPEEMHGPGSLHEEAGEQLLLKAGIDPKIARVCVSHAQWNHMDVVFEELCVALADKLWKGKRVEALEPRVIDACAHRLKKTRWEVFETLDCLFEEVAASGDERLRRSTSA